MKNACNIIVKNLKGRAKLVGLGIDRTTILK
jgi:hypothetical protein